MSGQPPAEPQKRFEKKLKKRLGAIEEALAELNENQWAVYKETALFRVTTGSIIEQYLLRIEALERENAALKAGLLSGSSTTHLTGSLSEKTSKISSDGRELPFEEAGSILSSEKLPHHSTSESSIECIRPTVSLQPVLFSPIKEKFSATPTTAFTPVPPSRPKPFPSSVCPHMPSSPRKVKAVLKEREKNMGENGPV